MIDDYQYRLGIDRIQRGHDLEAARIVREGKAEIAAYLKRAEQRQAQRQEPTPKAHPEAPSRKCQCGEPLKKRARYCKRCREKNRKTTKRQYQRKFRKSYCSTVNEKTPL